MGLNASAKLEVKEKSFDINAFVRELPVVLAVSSVIAIPTYLISKEHKLRNGAIALVATSSLILYAAYSWRKGSW